MLSVTVSDTDSSVSNFLFQASFQLEEQSTNFVNPVYDTMFADADEDDLLDSSGSGPILRVPVSPLGENVGGKVKRFITFLVVNNQVLHSSFSKPLAPVS